MGVNRQLKIGNKVIGDNYPCYIIAEAGVNHNGNPDLAFELVKAAKKTGADCVKFQTYKTERIIIKEAPKANYQLKSTDPKESQFMMLKKLELPLEVYPKLLSLCKKLKIQFLSTPYNFDDADFLNDLGVEAFKIASGQLVELAFLRYVAGFNKPIILSTGMANLSEVYDAVTTVRDAGNDKIVVLQCTTNYPSRIEDANISAMNSMRDSLNVLTGYSDHVPNNYAAYASVALGACVVEKHFTLDTELPGPDHKASLNPAQFKQFVTGVRNVEKSLGSSTKTPTENEIKNIAAMRRSIVAVKNIKKGQSIKVSDIDFKRPATGLSPQLFDKIIGKKATKNISANEMLNYNMIEW